MTSHLSIVGKGSIESITGYRYIRVLRFSLKALRSWPGQELGEDEGKCRTLLTIIFALYNLLFFLLNCLFLFNHSGSIDYYSMCQAFITASMGFISTSRIFQFPLNKRYRNLVKQYITDIHLSHFKNDSDFAMKMHFKVHRYSSLFTINLMAQMATALAFFQLVPIYNNYKNGLFEEKYLENSTYELAISFSLPINSTTNFEHYVFTCVIDAIISYFCASNICTFDLLLSLMVIHVWGHFQILLNDLNDIPKPSTVNKKNQGIINMRSKYNAHVYSAEEEVQVSDRLKKCIEYHQILTNFIKELSTVFGLMLLIYYGFHQMVGCLLLLVCSPMTGEVLMRFGPVSLILFQQLIQLSVIFEQIGTASGKLKDAVYDVPWECMNNKNKKTVLIFLMNVQEPIHVKAMGIANVGVTSMAAILKTSLSYFTFLLTVVK